MTVQMETIKKADQADAIYMLWLLMQERESAVDSEGRIDALGRIQVEGAYRLWNRITGDDKVPVWERRTKAVEAAKPEGTWVTLEEGPDDGDGYTVWGNPKVSGIYRVRNSDGDMYIAQFYFNAGGRTSQWHSILTGNPINFGEVGDQWLKV